MDMLRNLLLASVVILSGCASRSEITDTLPTRTLGAIPKIATTHGDVMMAQNVNGARLIMAGRPDIYIDGLKKPVLSGNWSLGKEDVAILQGTRNSCGLSYVLVSIFPDPLVLDIGDCKGNLVFQFYRDGVAIIAADRPVPQAWFYKQKHLSRVDLIKDVNATSGYNIILPGGIVTKEVKEDKDIIPPAVVAPVSSVSVPTPPPVLQLPVVTTPSPVPAEVKLDIQPAPKVNVEQSQLEIKYGKFHDGLQTEPVTPVIVTPMVPTPPVTSNTPSITLPVAPQPVVSTIPVVTEKPLAPVEAPAKPSRLIEPAEPYVAPQIPFESPVTEVVPRQPPSQLAEVPKTSMTDRVQDTSQITGYEVQFLAEASQANAETKMDFYKGRFPDLFTSHESAIRYAVINDKQYWRLRFINLPTYQDALNLCSVIRSRGLDCFVPNL